MSKLCENQFLGLVLEKSTKARVDDLKRKTLSFCELWRNRNIVKYMKEN